MADKTLPPIYVTHGQCDHPLYSVWLGMKSRCKNPNYKHYNNYGERGITVCEEWRTNFGAFLEWGISAGYAKGLTIERIDNDGNYEPSNCKWATWAEQCLNKRDTAMLTAFGETKSIIEWARDPRCKTTRVALKERLWKGVDPELAITAPLHSKNLWRKEKPYKLDRRA